VLEGGAGGAALADDTDHADAEDRGDAPAVAAGGFDPSRRLCDDGSCVGVVGSDGRCGVCGKEAAL
jgi:hypothetical protein